MVDKVDNEKNKLKNVIEFYLLANNLKYATKDNKQSLADQIYGTMILAVAMNSEYHKTENIGETIKTILFGTLNFYYPNETKECMDKLSKATTLITDINKCSIELSDFAFECTMSELALEYFFENFLLEEELDTKNCDELYMVAKNYGIVDRLGTDEVKNYEIFKFYYQNRVLKKKERSGWDSKHWNVSINRIERISEHIVGTIALAIALDSEFDFKVDIDKVITALCIHEIGEIRIGDITPFDGITPDEKKKIEHKAMVEVLGNLKDRDLFLNMLFSFDEQDTFDSKFAHYCDKLEADIQAKVYQDMGYQHSLAEQEGNIVFNSSRVQQMIRDGAKTAFDIWYEWDKGIYIDEPVFTKTLQFVRDNKLT